jgi:hypothetical protein
MDNIDQVNMDNQLPEPSIQPVLPDVEKENNADEDGLSQPTMEVVESNVAGRKIEMLWTDFTDKLDAQKVSNVKAATCKIAKAQLHITTRFYQFKPI